MALLFDSAKTPAVTSYNLLHNWSSQAGKTILGILYQGTQPNVADYTTNWSSNYYFDTSNGNVGSDVLGIYGDHDKDGNPSNELSLNLAGSTGTARYYTFTDSYYQKTHKANGTATWMAIILLANESTYWNGMTSSDFYSHGYFIIVPVTNSSGNGVVKLASTTIYNSLPNISNITLNIS